MEPLSFDSPAETDVVRRFPTSAKVFVFASAGTRIIIIIIIIIIMIKIKWGGFLLP